MYRQLLKYAIQPCSCLKQESGFHRSRMAISTKLGKFVGHYNLLESQNQSTPRLSCLIYRRRWRSITFYTESRKFFCTTREWQGWHWSVEIVTISIPQLHLMSPWGIFSEFWTKSSILWLPYSERISIICLAVLIQILIFRRGLQ